MIRRMFDGLAKWIALRSYRQALPRFLVERYGREPHYTPAQVLTTIQVHRLSERFAPYACAMFCSKRAYDDFAARHVVKGDTSLHSLSEPSFHLWPVLLEDWPTHHEIVVEMGHHAQPDHHGT